MLPAATRLRRREDFAATIKDGRRAGRDSIVVHVRIVGRTVEGYAAEGHAAQGHAAEGYAAEGHAAESHAAEGYEPGRTASESTRPAAYPAREPSRAGFVVSKAVGGAVVRNRVKRRLRHLVRERLAAIPAGTDIVVRALPAAATRTFKQLGEDLDGALAAATRPRPNRGRESRSTSRDHRAPAATGSRTERSDHAGGGL